MSTWLKLKTEHVYVREGLLVNFVLLFCLNIKIVIELNRPLNSVHGIRSSKILRLRRFILRLVLFKSYKIVCVSEEIYLSLSSVQQAKARVFENFFGFINNVEIDTDLATVKQFDAVIIADIEQPWQAKDFIEAFLCEYPHRRLLHIGKGNFSAKNATSVGQISDLTQLRSLAKSAVVAFSQLGLKRIGLTEATPLKHVDYVSCRLPIISGAIDKLLSDVYPVFVLDCEDTKFLDSLIVRVEENLTDTNVENLLKKIHDYSTEYRVYCLS